MPNCYYLISSTPDETRLHALDCGEKFGGQTTLVAQGLKSKRFHILVHFDQLEDAQAALEPIKRCLVEQGHSVDRGYEVIEDVGEPGSGA